ncbi:MAG: SDR family oxidoreductase [Candidatus Omnitrophica bacterium]|nr:SDR family oxidoreductase [Candidatus Omnitrophota bacterium]MCA9443141.1 SDR family oxidoreductase [Candidatus Omnitrophota bacterium]
MTKVVIGGCGYVGTRLAELLIDKGDEVLAIRRRPPAETSPIRWASADLAEPNSLSSLDLECDFAVYCAAADEPTEGSYTRAYVQGLNHFLERLKECSPQIRRVVFTSSTGVYGQDDGSWVSEESPTKPVRFTGQKVLEGEKLLMESGLPGIVVRFGGIYGPGRDRLLRMISEGRVQLTDTPSFTNRIHREDCARSILHLLHIENPQFAYNGVDNDPSDRNEVYSWLAEQLGVHLEKEEDQLGSGPSGKRIRNNRLVESGYRFVYPTFREGYAEFIKEWLEKK